jgi:hypothetical protein
MLSGAFFMASVNSMRAQRAATPLIDYLRKQRRHISFLKALEGAAECEAIWQASTKCH